MSQFDELPEGWALATFGDVCQVQGGFAFKSKDYQPDGVLLVRISNLVDGKVEINEKSAFLPEIFFGEFTSFRLEIGDVLIAMSGATTGKMAVYNLETPALLNQRVGRFCIVAPNSVDPGFVSKLVGSVTEKVLQKAYGGAQPNISPKELERFPIPLPPLNEQRRIVEKIEALTARSRKARAALDEIPGLLDQFRQSVLAAAFRGDLTADWRAQNPDVEPAEALLERIGAGIQNISDSIPLPELPDGWEWTTLGEIGQVSGGLTKNSKRREFSHEFPYLRVANVYSNKLDLEEIKTIKVQESEIKRVCLEKGDLLIVEGNGSLDQIGRVALWDGSIAKCLHQNHLIKVRFNPIEISSYTLLWLLSERGRRYITLVASSTSGLHTLSISKVSALPIPIAPQKEQGQIIKRVNTLLNSLEEMRHQFWELDLHSQKLDQSILAKAFRGELVPQDPNDEPAAVLLDRIRAERERLGSGKKRGKAKT